MVTTRDNTTYTFPNARTINLLNIVGNSPSKVTHWSAQTLETDKLIKIKPDPF